MLCEFTPRLLETLHMKRPADSKSKVIKHMSFRFNNFFSLCFSTCLGVLFSAVFLNDFFLFPEETFSAKFAFI